MKPIRFYLIALVVVICDQISKWAVTTTMPLGASRPALGRLLLITHTENTGGAFSLLQARNGVFIAVAVVAMAALIYAYHRFQRRDLYVSAALALALGGAVGNVIDRIRLGHVIDFFDLQFRGSNIWPIFNVADSAISIGILILAWHFLFKREEQGDHRPQTTDHRPQAADDRSPSSVVGGPSSD